MSLSITNTNHIKQEEIAAIARCNLNSELIALKMDEAGGAKIVTLSKSEVTCWQMFLRIFGLGDLTHYKVHLSDIVTHLNQFDWKVAASLDHDSEYYQAYLKACTLANKALYSKWDETLINNVSNETLQKSIEFAQYQGSRITNKHSIQQSFRWNPSLQVKHIRAALLKQYRNMTIRIEDENHHVLDADCNISRTQFNNIRIFIEQRLADPKPEVVVIHTTTPCHHHHHTNCHHSAR